MNENCSHNKLPFIQIVGLNMDIIIVIVVDSTKRK